MTDTPLTSEQASAMVADCLEALRDGDPNADWNYAHGMRALAALLLRVSELEAATERYWDALAEIADPTPIPMRGSALRLDEWHKKIAGEALRAGSLRGEEGVAVGGSRGEGDRLPTVHPSSSPDGAPDGCTCDPPRPMHETRWYAHHPGCPVREFVEESSPFVPCAACGLALVDPAQTGADGLSICDDCREAPDGVS